MTLGYKKQAQRLIDKAKQAEKNQATAPEPSPTKEPGMLEPQKEASEPSQTPQQQPKQELRDVPLISVHPRE